MNKINEKKLVYPEMQWSDFASPLGRQIVELAPVTTHPRVLEIGCGCGKDAVYLAQKGYDVTAFDSNPSAVKAAKGLADQCGVPLTAFVADLREYRLTSEFDVIYSSAVLHFMPRDMREQLFAHYKQHTSKNGLHVHSAYVCKSMSEIQKTSHIHGWLLGELMLLYKDWKLEYELLELDTSGLMIRDGIQKLIYRNQY